MMLKNGLPIQAGKERRRVQLKIHIVQKGDTLWEIAKQYGVDFNELKNLNTQLSNPELIMPGMKIKIPGESKAVKNKAIHKGAPAHQGPVHQGPVHQAPVPVQPPKAKQIEVPFKALPTVPAPELKEDDLKPAVEIQPEVPIYQAPQLPPQQITTLPKIEFDVTQQQIVQQQVPQTPIVPPIVQPKPEAPVQPIVQVLPIHFYPVPQPYPVPQHVPQHVPSPSPSPCGGETHLQHHYVSPCGSQHYGWHHQGHDAYAQPYSYIQGADPYSQGQGFAQGHGWREYESYDQRTESTQKEDTQENRQAETANSYTEQPAYPENQYGNSQDTYYQDNVPRYFNTENIYAAQPPYQSPYDQQLENGLQNQNIQGDSKGDQESNRY